MSTLYRIEELTTEGWTLLENKSQKLSKEECDRMLDMYVSVGLNPNRLRAVVDV